jgi:hypothetical protein
MYARVALFIMPECRFYEIPAYIEQGALVGAGR